MGQESRELIVEEIEKYEKLKDSDKQNIVLYKLKTGVNLLGVATILFAMCVKPCVVKPSSIAVTILFTTAAFLYRYGELLAKNKKIENENNLNGLKKFLESYDLNELDNGILETLEKQRNLFDMNKSNEGRTR